MIKFLLIFFWFFGTVFAAKIVGVAVDMSQKPDKNSYSPYPFFAIRQSYIDSIQDECKKYDVNVLLLPIRKDMARAYSSMIDGLVLIGNNYDIDPSKYNETLLNKTVNLREKPDQRFEFEYAILSDFIAKNKPILGICGGMQLINILHGGSLYQDIPTQIKTKINHRIKPHVTVHKIELENDTLLAKIAKNERSFSVNSAHHQAVKELGKNLVANAYSEDGLIEGLEGINHPFLIGTQWHPEFGLANIDKKIFNEFCKKVSQI
jgi:putative glutamine amidotransferase